MKASLSVLLLLALCSSPSWSQLQGQLLEEGTGLPLEGVVITSNKEQLSSGKDGLYALKYSIDDDTVFFRLIGYYPLQRKAGKFRRQQVIYLRRIYNTMPAAEVRAKGINVEEIIDRFVARIPEHYIPANIALQYDFTAVLHRDADTAADIYVPLRLQHQQSKVPIGYQSYYDAKEGITFRSDRLSTGLINDYIASWEVIGSAEHPLKKLGKARLRPSGYNTFISVFTDNGKEMYDIVLITKKPIQMAYDDQSLALGYGPSKNQAARKSYVNLFNFRTSKSDYILVSYADIAIAIDDKAYETFNAITDRNDVNEWVAKAQESGVCYYKMMTLFGPLAGAGGQYGMLKQELTDNLFCPVYRERSAPGYTLNYHLHYKGMAPADKKKMSGFRLQGILQQIYDDRLSRLNTMADFRNAYNTYREDLSQDPPGKKQ